MGWRLRAKKKKIDKEIDRSIKALCGISLKKLGAAMEKKNNESFIEFVQKFKTVRDGESHNPKL